MSRRKIPQETIHDFIRLTTKTWKFLKELNDFIICRYARMRREYERRIS
jgi:hypothetical protein